MSENYKRPAVVIVSWIRGRIGRDYQIRGQIEYTINKI